jgi:hypothetical protein
MGRGETARMRKLIPAAIAGALLFGACNTGLSKITERYKDAPRGRIDRSAADVILMPDGFSNVSSKCDGPNRVYVVFHSNAAYGAVSVAPNDPRCAR